MKRILALALAFGLAIGPASAQSVPRYNVPIGAGPGSIGWLLAPPGTSGRVLASNGAASTPSFQAFPLAGLALSNGYMYLGGLSNFPAAQIMAGDCTITNTGAITCTKYNGVPFGSIASTNLSTSGSLSITALSALALLPSGVSPGPYGSATTCVTFNVNQAGQVISASATTCTPAFSSVTGTMTGNQVLAALSVACSTANKYLQFIAAQWQCGSGFPGSASAANNIAVWADTTGLRVSDTGVPLSNVAFIVNALNQTLSSAGANINSYPLSPPAQNGTLTLNCGNGPLQWVSNTGAFIIAAPTNDGSCIIAIRNNAVAGAITLSGFSVGANTGDTLSNIALNKYMLNIVRIQGTSTYSVKANQ